MGAQPSSHGSSRATSPTAVHTPPTTQTAPAVTRTGTKVTVSVSTGATGMYATPNSSRVPLLSFGSTIRSSAMAVAAAPVDQPQVTTAFSNQLPAKSRGATPRKRKRQSARPRANIPSSGSHQSATKLGTIEAMPQVMRTSVAVPETDFRDSPSTYPQAGVRTSTARMIRPTMKARAKTGTISEGKSPVNHSEMP